MNKNRYGVGLNAAIGTEKSVKLCNLREAVSFAREHGIGFIVQYQYRYGRPLRRVILGWNIKILSYQEAVDKYADNHDMMNVITLAGKNKVFIVSPCGEDNREIIFPFMDELHIVNLNTIL